MDWIAELKDATDGFAKCLAEGDLAADVPSCPGWTLADLGEHLRTVHLWAAHAVTEGNPDGNPAPIDASELVDGYRDAAGHLLEVLRSTPEDAPAWTFGPEPVAGFWRRRQTHETVMHLYDALLARGREGDWPITAELAWDGVDEVAGVFYPRQVRFGRIEPLVRPMRVTATDLDQSLVLGDGEPALTLEAPATDLLLTLWRRIPATEPEVAAVLAGTAITP